MNGFDADLQGFPGGESRDLTVGKKDSAGVSQVESRQDFGKSVLAGALVARQSVYLAAVDRKIDVVQYLLSVADDAEIADTEKDTLIHGQS